MEEQVLPTACRVSNGDVFKEAESCRHERSRDGLVVVPSRSRLTGRLRLRNVQGPDQWLGESTSVVHSASIAGPQGGLHKLNAAAAGKNLRKDCKP